MFGGTTLGRLAAGFILALPLPAAAAEGWLADPRSGCKAWINNIESGSTIRWEGVCTGGYAEGRGTLEYLHGGKVAARIEGEFKSGKRNGRALVIWDGGQRFEGEYRDGMVEGRGIHIFANGDRYDGMYQKNQRSGHGVYTYSDGSRYEGEYRDDKRNGRGIMTWKTGGRYEGEWRDDNYNGRGTETWPDGGRYEGEFKDDKPDGMGTYRGRNDKGKSDIWSGEWRDGCFSVPGKHVALSKSRAECGFE